jgi:hypothetical protein
VNPGIGNVQNTDCVICSDRLWIVKSPSPVKSIVIEFYRKDYRRSNCDTADGSNCKIVNGVNVRASGINSLYPIQCEVNCRITHPTRDNIMIMDMLI